MTPSQPGSSPTSSPVDELLGAPARNTPSAVDMLLGPAPNASRQPLSNVEALLGPPALATASPPAPTAAPRRSILAEFPAGVAAGTERLAPQFAALGGLAAKAFGADEVARDLAVFAQQSEEQISRDFPQSVTFDEAFNSGPGNAARFVLRALGEQVPVVASVILGGGIGSLVGRLVGRGLITSEKGLQALAKFAPSAGGIGVITGIETGSTAEEQFSATGDVQPLVALSAGIAKGALESIVPIAFAKRFGLFPGQAGELIGRINAELNKVASRPLRAGITAVGSGVVEGATEFTQEAVDVAARAFVDDNFDVLSPDTKSRLLESLTTGAIVGFIFGGIAGGVGGPSGDRPMGTTDAGTGTTAVPDDAPDPGDFIGPPAPLDQLVTVVDAGAEVGDFPTFKSQERAQFDVADKGVRNVRLLGVRPGEITPENTTALLEDLPGDPKTIKASNPDISFVGAPTQEEKQQALAALREAITIRNRAFEAAKIRDPSASVEKAARTVPDASAMEAFAKAIALGLRVKADVQKGFVFLGKPKQLREVSTEDFSPNPKALTEGVFINFDTFNNGKPTIVARELGSPNANVFRVGTGDETNFTQDAGSGSVQAIRRFKVDVGKALKEGLRLAATDFSLVRARLEEIADNLGIGSAVTVADVERIVDAQQGVSFAPGVTVQNKKNLAKTVSEFRTLTSSGFDFGDGIAKRQLVDKLLTNKLIVDQQGLAGDFALVGDGKVFFGALEEVPIVPNPRKRVQSQPVPVSASDNILGNPALKDLETGQPYDRTTHPEGTAKVVLDASVSGEPTAEQLAKYKKIAKFYTKLLAKFGFKHKVLIFAGEALTNPGSFTVSLDSALGIHLPVEDPTLGIFMFDASKDFIAPTEQADDLAAVTVHEFGHFITRVEFAKTDPGVQRQILNAYNRFIIKSAFGSTQDFAFGFRSVLSHTLSEQFSAKNVPIRSAFPFAFSGFDYWLNFDEFMAEQIARQMLSRTKPLTTVERFFQGVAAKIKSLFLLGARLQGKSLTDFRAEPAVEAWLESLVTRQKVTAAVSAGQTAVAEVTQKSLEANTSVLPEGTATPGDVIGLQVDTVLKKLRVSKKDRGLLRATLDKFGWLMKWGFSLGQLASRNPHIRPLQRYVELTDQMFIEASKWKSMANSRTREWEALGKAQQDKLALFIFDVDQMKYLKKGEAPRQPTEAELAELVKRRGLEPETFEIFQQIRKDFDLFLDKLQELLERDIRATVDTKVVADLKVQEMLTDMAKLRARPYFPHSRFGDFAVVVKELKTGKTLFMQQFESKRSAVEAFPRIRTSFAGEEFGVGLTKIPKEAMPFRGLPPTLLKAMQARLDLTEDQQEWLDNFIIEFSPGASFRKRLKKRKDIPGFSLDALRSYAKYFVHGSMYLARVEFGGALQEAINDTVREGARLRDQGVDTTKRVDIIDFMQNHLNHIMNPGVDWAQVQSAAFIWWLGFSPVSAFINFTQVPMVAYPFLAANFGDGAAVKALTKAMVDLKKTYTNKTTTVGDAFINALAEGIAQGTLDESQAVELAAIADGSNLSRLLPGTKFHRAQMQFSQYAAWMFQMSEKINRRQVFRAAWELAKANPDVAYLQKLKDANTLEFERLTSTEAMGDRVMSKEEALAFLAGRDAVRQTQFQYAKHARPRFMRGRKGTLFTFFMFTQQMLFFTAFSPGRGRYLLMMLFAAGLMGLPGAEDIQAVVRFIARKTFGKDFDVERELRRLVTSTLDANGPTADLILHGASREGFGIPAALDVLGLPAPQVDLSANVGLGQIIPGVTELGRPGIEFDSAFGRATEQAAGAAFGVGINLLKFMSDNELDFTDGKRYERALPRAMRNVARAMRFYNEERERSRTGTTVLEFDASDPQQVAEIVAQGLGFTPTRLSRKWDRTRMEAEAKMFWQTRRGILFKQFDHAVAVKDMPTRRDVLAAIKRYNKGVPFPSKRITAKDLRNSVKARQRSRRLAEAGLPASKRDAAVVRDVQGLFPTVPQGVHGAEVVDAEDMTRKR